MASGFYDLLAFLLGRKSAVQQGNVVTVVARDVYVGGAVVGGVSTGEAVAADVYVGGAIATEAPD